MPYNETLANRVRELIAEAHYTHVTEKRMFGGLCFMVNDKLCAGVKTDRIMVRLDPEIFEEVLEQDGCTPMSHSGKTMKGYVFVDAGVLNTKSKLAHWINLALIFNRIAKASKK